ncbi:MAG: hypothetical protein Q9186_005327 [Xanthomendoza sp. 1 TL-2023]
MDTGIKYEDLAYGTQYGFASVGSNNGHNGTTALAMYRNPDVVVDFAWRALHVATTASKQLIKRFYHHSHKKSYLLGCSLGGRQGINAADILPHDFDGIIAGSPTLDFNNLQSWRARFFTITGSNTSSHFIPKRTWKELIHEEILKQCDGLDGVVDGIIEDPNLCQFQPGALLCSQHDGIGTDCLTKQQVEIVRKIFSPFSGEDGNLIYPAMQPGSEIKAADLFYAGVPFSNTDEWFKYVVYTPSTWNASLFTSHDATVADALNPSNIRTWPSSLSLFKNRGGKLLLYHGGQDEKLTSFNTERFYNHLAHGMQSSPAVMDDFLRFFRIPGMGHCNSGPGAWVFGQGGGAPAAGIPFNAEQNVLAAIVRWVEEEEAVDEILGTKFVEDNVKKGVEYQRRHLR